MATMHQNPPPNDLKITVHSSCMVFPSQETERKTLFLSNIDQVLTFDVQTVHFFAAHKDFPSQVIVEKIKEILGEILVPYDLLAGRLKLNTETGRLEIDCCVSGAGFVAATSDYSLDEIGDLVYPNPAFAQLVCSTLDILKSDDKPLCILQVTSFKCGGFALGFTINHSTFDGLSFKQFLQNMASLATNNTLAIQPRHVRHLLAARTPPRVTLPHPELVQLPPSDSNPNPNYTVLKEVPDEELGFKIFHLSFGEICSLKEKAKSGGISDGDRHITSFNVVTAFIWQCKALSFGNKTDGSRQSTILYAVDIRRRLNPPLPPGYAGNAVLTAYATCECEKLEEGPFSKIVEMVAEGAKRMSDEYARSVIDWGELYKGFPNGEALISSWWRLGFTEIDFPWGRPRYSCPVVYRKKDIILFFPDIDDHHQPHHHHDHDGLGNRKDGVNVLLTLPADEMEKFETLYDKLLSV